MLSVFLLAGLAMAQPAGPAARGRARAPRLQTNALQTELQLTDQQIGQLRELRRKQAQDLKPALQQMRDEGQRLKDLLESSNPDPAAVGRQVLALRALREQMKVKRGSLSDQAQGVLTQQQRDKLKQIEGSRDLLPALRQARILGLLDAPEPDRQSPVRRAPRTYRGRL
jgi:Spy/CpxP family protein refolding chaperone